MKLVYDKRIRTGDTKVPFESQMTKVKSCEAIAQSIKNKR